MMLAPKIVGNSGRGDVYAVLLLWIGSKERQIHGNLLGSLDVADESETRPGNGETFYPGNSLIFEDIHDQVVSLMPENLLPNLREGPGSAQ